MVFSQKMAHNEQLTFIHSCKTTDAAVVTNAGVSAVLYTHEMIIYGTHSRI